MCGNRLGAEYLKKLSPLAWLGFVRAHFDDHRSSTSAKCCGTRSPLQITQPPITPRTASTLWILFCLGKVAWLRPLPGAAPLSMLITGTSWVSVRFVGFILHSRLVRNPVYLPRLA